MGRNIRHLLSLPLAQPASRPVQAGKNKENRTSSDEERAESTSSTNTSDKDSSSSRKGIKQGSRVLQENNELSRGKIGASSKASLDSTEGTTRYYLRSSTQGKRSAESPPMSSGGMEEESDESTVSTDLPRKKVKRSDSVITEKNIISSERVKAETTGTDSEEMDAGSSTSTGSSDVFFSAVQKNNRENRGSLQGTSSSSSVRPSPTKQQTSLRNPNKRPIHRSSNKKKECVATKSEATANLRHSHRGRSRRKLSKGGKKSSLKRLTHKKVWKEHLAN